MVELRYVKMTFSALGSSSAEGFCNIYNEDDVCFSMRILHSSAEVCEAFMLSLNFSQQVGTRVSSVHQRRARRPSLLLVRGIASSAASPIGSAIQ